MVDSVVRRLAPPQILPNPGDISRASSGGPAGSSELAAVTPSLLFPTAPGSMIRYLRCRLQSCRLKNAQAIAFYRQIKLLPAGLSGLDALSVCQFAPFIRETRRVYCLLDDVTNLAYAFPCSVVPFRWYSSGKDSLSTVA